MCVCVCIYIYIYIWNDFNSCDEWFIDKCDDMYNNKGVDYRPLTNEIELIFVGCLNKYVL